VLETLEPLAADRKCFRLINGVLVERTVSDVVPALKTNQEGLKKVLDDLVKQYKSKQDELDKWKVRVPAHRLTHLVVHMADPEAEEEQCAGSATIRHLRIQNERNQRQTQS
jgi:polyhydroxyalkanoate synthesis regulator phasin